MITPERIEEIEDMLVSGGEIVIHKEDCTIVEKGECNCVFGIARELLSELKESLAREEKNREEITRFAKKLSGWIEDQIKP